MGFRARYFVCSDCQVKPATKQVAFHNDDETMYGGEGYATWYHYCDDCERKAAMQFYRNRREKKMKRKGR